MRILVIGSGGREHALVWKLKQSPRVSEVFVAPGNGGTAREGAINVAVDAGDLDGLVELAREEKIDLVVPGPELPLTKGITDRMHEAGIPCFGPDAYCARLEGSKAFAKDVMNRAGVPTAHSQVFTDPDKAKNAVVKLGAPLVVKADGLAAGKGVVVAKTTQEALDAVDDIMCKRAHGAAGAKLVIEEFLVGEEASFLCLCDGKTAVPLPSAQDHKAAYDGDQGPNTGGMGAYSPAPILPYNEAEAMADTVIRPILAALAKDGHPFVGVLYAGLMMTGDGPRVLEYNTRFGDPECQPLLMRLEGDLVQIMLDCIEGKLRPESLSHTSQTALGVVVAAEGYPHAYPKGMVIEGLDEADALPGVKVFHSGTSMDGDKTLSSGGRVLCVISSRYWPCRCASSSFSVSKASCVSRTDFSSPMGSSCISDIQSMRQMTAIIRSAGRDDVDDEYECVAAADAGRRHALAAIAILRRNRHDQTGADVVAGNGLIPAANHLADADAEACRLVAGEARIEGRVLAPDHTVIVHGHRVAAADHRPVTLDDLHGLQSLRRLVRRESDLRRRAKHGIDLRHVRHGLPPINNAMPFMAWPQVVKRQCHSH